MLLLRWKFGFDVFLFWGFLDVGGIDLMIWMLILLKSEGLYI